MFVAEIDRIDSYPSALRRHAMSGLPRTAERC